MPLSDDLALALSAVRDAMRVCEAVRARLDTTTDARAKSDDSPVTLADLAAQVVVARRLETHRPADPLVGEEDPDVFDVPGGADLLLRVTELCERHVPSDGRPDARAALARGRGAGGSRGRFWTLDPIDGTKGFLRGDQYAVALALIEDGVVTLGVLGCPNLWTTDRASRGVVFHAVRGGGAWSRTASGTDAPARLGVNTLGEADLARHVFAESFESGHSSHDHSARIAARLGVTAPPVRADSQAKYGLVARGEAGIYLRLPVKAGYQEKIWDHAAGVVLVEEAGGRVSDVDGRALDFSRGRTLADNRGVIATNGRVHDVVLAATRAVLSGG